MFRVLDCIANAHDTHLVILAVVLCFFASAVAMGIADRVRVSVGRLRVLWLVGAAVVAGSGIWATHFVAMLAYQPGFPVDYDIGMTIFSILIAVCLSGVGFVLALADGRPLLGGAIVGVAICAMHYVGTAAMRVPAREIWDLRYVAASLVIGIGAMALAMRLITRAKSLPAYIASTTVFTVAICAMHFTGMTALRFAYDPTVLTPTGVLAPAILAAAIAALAVLIIGIGMVLALTDRYLAWRAGEEAGRLHVYIAELEATRAELQEGLCERARALTEAAEANRAKSKFLAAMSHELRTPLNAIIGFSDLMISQTFGPLGDARYKDYLKDIRNAGEHLLLLINDVLDLSRVDAGKLQLNPEALSIGHTVAEALSMVQTFADTADVALQSDVARDLPNVFADARRITQVLINLLSNAIKFTPAGGHVVVAAHLVSDGLAISVRDTGIGIAPADIAKTMEEFTQIDSSLARQYPGSGLGLPLARQLMKLHGGSLTLESELGAGTTVTAKIPASRVLANATRSAFA